MKLKFYHAEGLNVTIHTNNNCTLKCSYCYELNKPSSKTEDEKFWISTTHKNDKRNYNFLKSKCEPKIVDINTAKKFIDNILEIHHTKFFKQLYTKKDKIILEFLGGDSLQYPELLDEILTYFCYRLIKTNSRWKYSWIVSISSNGVTLLNPKARQFCEKWKSVLSVGLSIDGCPELHNLNRWCFADNEDGSHRGSWQYIEEIWPWYKKIFPDDSLRTKWTLAPNSYKYMYQSVKFLHEELGMKYIFFNRVMEDYVLDTAEELWVLIQQFEKTINYLVQHHLDLCCETFSYINTKKVTKEEQKDIDIKWSRCGFGKMPALGLDGKVYPCFRLLPGNNHLKYPTKYAQGTNRKIISNEKLLNQLNFNSTACNLLVPKKCEVCDLYITCPHCAADCINENDDTLTKTTSVCNFTRLQVYFARKYWEIIVNKYPELYKNYFINWTQDDQNNLLKLVLQEIINIKNKGEEDVNCKP
jgi:uncharacterized protein